MANEVGPLQPFQPLGMVQPPALSCSHPGSASRALRSVPGRKGTSCSIRVHVRASMPGCTQRADAQPRATSAHTVMLPSPSACECIDAHMRTHTRPRACTHRHMECARDPEGVECCQQQAGL